jgi:hypothetical protein
LKKLLAAIYKAGYYGNHSVFNLASGPFHSCKFAKDCAASVAPLGAVGRPLSRDKWNSEEMVARKIVNGPHQIYRCYAASMEAAYKSLYNVTQGNLDMLLKAAEMGGQEGIQALLEESMKHAGLWDTGSVIRLHSNGDFFSEEYLWAWLEIMTQTPSNRYYAYTKAVEWYWQALTWGYVPDNFNMTMSRGGTQDRLITRYGLKESIVVGSEQEARELGLEVDDDDSHALFGDQSFALVIHGSGNAKLKGTHIQPAIILPMAAD